jgi:hypothetical protein
VIDVPPPPTSATWHKSSSSTDSGCVEVARTTEYVWVRDTKDRNGGTLGFTRTEWAAFLAGVQRGEFGSTAEYT